MNKIELSKEELAVIKLQLDGKIEVYSATEEQQNILMGVIDKANALMDDLHADDELDDFIDDGLIGWYYDKYKKTKKINEQT